MLPNGILTLVRRRPFVIASGALVLIIAAVFTVRACSSPSDVEAPSAHTLVPAWDNEINGLPFAFDAQTGTVLLWAQPAGAKPLADRHVAAVDVRTGKQKWAKAPPGWSVNIDYIRGGKLTARAVIVQSNYLKSQPAIAAMQLTDGKTLWKVNTPGPSARKTAVTKDVVVVSWDDKTYRGLSASDGEKLWETQVPDGCHTDDVAGHDDLAVVEVVCEKKRQIRSLDLRTGEVRWERNMSIEGEVTHDNLQVSGAAIMFSDQDHVVVLDESGKILVDEPSRGSGEIRLAATADLAVATYTNLANVQTITAIDLRQGTVRWSRPLAVGALSFSGQRIFALAALPVPLLPVGLYEIDPATGAMAVSPTHLLHVEYDSLVAIEDDLVVTQYVTGRTTPRTSHLAAHQLKPPTIPDGFVGGAPSADWPDSCALLDPAQLATAVGGGVTYTPQPRPVTVLDVALAHPAQCRYQSSTVTAPQITVSIVWVGVDAEQSSQVINRVGQRMSDAKDVSGIGDEAFEYVEFGEVQSTTHVYFRVGRHVGKVTVGGDGAVAHELARLAFTRLG